MNINIKSEFQPVTIAIEVKTSTELAFLLGVFSDKTYTETLPKPEFQDFVRHFSNDMRNAINSHKVETAKADFLIKQAKRNE